DDDAHAGLIEVAELASICRLDHRSDRDGELECRTVGSRPVIAHTGTPALARAMRPTVIPQQRCDLVIRDEHNVTAETAVATVGAGERFELLPTNRNTPV